LADAIRRRNEVLDGSLHIVHINFHFVFQRTFHFGADEHGFDVRTGDVGGALQKGFLDLFGRKLRSGVLLHGAEQRQPLLPRFRIKQRGSSARPWRFRSTGSKSGRQVSRNQMTLPRLRPTYGRVARTGAMTLCRSLDKLGPMARSVEDAMLVLHAISGPDPGDLGSVSGRLDFDSQASVKGLRAGYFPAWMHEAPATEVDRGALRQIEHLGMTPVEVALPDWPYGSLNAILFAESAAAFEELTLNHKVDELKVQTPDAWPNTFRQSRFISAVDFVPADRMRRSLAVEMDRLFSQVDLLLVPAPRDEMLTISNFTGHPSLTLRAGFVEVSQARSDWAPEPSRPLPRFSPPRRVPHGVTLVGRLFDEGTMASAGLALERALNVAGERPPGF
jgi:Amidase